MPLITFFRELARPFTWLGRHERGLLIALVVITAGVWLFAEIADEVVEGATDKLDRRILLSMRDADTKQPSGPPALRQAAQDVTALGGTVVITFLIIVVGLYLILDGRWHMGLFVWASTFTGMAAGGILKAMFERARPEYIPPGVYVFGSSFPSGHAMQSAITYLTLGALLARTHKRKRVKTFVLMVSVLITIAVGVTRVYLGVHWPTDVLAGWTAGAVWALLAWTVASWFQRRGVIEQESDLAPESPEEQQA